MKKFVLFALSMLLVVASFAQKMSKKEEAGKMPVVDTRIDNMEYWMEMAEKGAVQYNPPVPIPAAEFKGPEIIVDGILIDDSPDVPVSSATNITESENSIFVDPNDNQYVLNSNNSTSWSGGSVGSLYGANYFQSADGGTTWGGSASGAGGDNSGDPTTAIGLNGRQYVNYIDDPGGQGIAYSDNGTSWFTSTVAPNPGSLADKNHMWIDNSPSSAYEGNLYVAWTAFGGTNDSEIVISRSTDDGVTWSSPINLSSAVAAGSHNQGVNVQTGPNGEVYVTWTIYDSWPSDETAIGFAKSTNGGVSYTTGTRIISNIKGIRTTETSKNHRVNSFPSMAVDISGGANDGSIYIVWSNIGVPGTNTGTNISVYMIRSVNGGTSWSTPIRVNQGPNVAGKESYFPWITCDPETGNLGVIFYDDRNTTSTSCETWVAYSVDGGSNWLDFRVSDVTFTPTPITGLASSYMGDYLAITARGNKFYPCWTDTRNGLFMTYVSPFELGLNASFNADNTSVCSGNTVTFTDLSSGNPISWTWSFPGGTPSSYSGQNPPAITYNTPGTYNVSLTVGDGVDTDTETKTGYITVANVFADFIGIPTTVVVGNSVSFTDQSSCDPTGWSWSFPGGTPSSYVGQTPPAIQYDTEGSYDVTLTVTKGGSNDIETKTGYITVVPPEFNITNGTVTTCMGNFYDSGGPTGSYSNNETFVETFYPSTSGSMMRFNFSSFSIESGWDYLYIYNGENTSSPLMGTYTGSSSPGTVTASNTSGALTFRFTSDGSVTSSGWIASIECYNTNVPPVADFSASTTTPVINTDVVFTDQSSNIPTSWTWSFSPNTVIYINSTNSSSQNPEVQFTDFGLYSVTLEVSNAYGTDTEVKTDYINVGSCTHCSSSGSTGDEEWISNVTFNTINNSSVVGTGYTDYTSISTDVTPGSLYNASVTCGSIGTWTENIWIFVDWNQDCDFDDAGESYDLGSTTGPGSLNTDITIPNEAIAGPTLMRVSLKFSSDPTACESFSFGEVEDYTVNVQGTALEIALTAFLEGAYDALADQMGTDLNTAGHVPVTQPYNPSLPYYGNNNPVWMYAGSESVGTIPTGAVDWVVVQLRDATTAANATSGTIIGTQAGFLMNDGSIRGTDGLSNLLYEVTVTNNLYAVIYHRNHLGIMSANGLTESGGVYSYDFTSSSTQTYGGVNAVKELEPGVWGMVAADGDANGLIQNTDETSVWQTDLGSSGYKGGDYDMNGLTQNTDETGLWQPNLGGGGQIPAKGAAVMFKSYIPE
ncbi:MAG: PKD domain-containing protein [Bacteroidales bacterium]|nr:PKD domain-containing protein [Bacteroidales bacterium]